VEVFSRFEANGFPWGDGDFGSGARVSSDSGFTGFDGEDSESAELDAVAFGEGLLHGFEDGVDGGLGLGSNEPGPFDHPLDEILFDQLGAFPAYCDGSGRFAGERAAFTRV
jgi:hypothetical protein